MKQLLVDFKPIKLTLDEAAEGGKIKVRGEFARCDTPTANKRVYEKPLWEREIGRLNKGFKTRSVMGEMDHPADGKTSLNRVSHIVTNLEIDENGILIGEAEILPTERGKNLAALLKSGVMVGVSSRGYGSLKTDKSGNEVVQEDYRLNTFDFVADPADQTAYPALVSESVEDSKVFSGVEIVEEDKTPTAPVVEVTNPGLGSQVSSYLKSIKSDLSEEIINKAVEKFKEISENHAVVQTTTPDINVTLATELQEARERIVILESLNEELQSELHQIKVAKVFESIPAEHRSLVETLIGEVSTETDTSTLQLKVNAIIEHLSKFAKPEPVVEPVVSPEVKKELAEKDEEILKLKGAVGELSEAVQVLALRVKTDTKLRVTPNAERVRAALEESNVSSEGEVDAVISATTSFRAPKDSDDAQAARARVRKHVRGGVERTLISEDAPIKPVPVRGTADYNGTGLDLDYLLQLTAGNR